MQLRQNVLSVALLVLFSSTSFAVRNGTPISEKKFPSVGTLRSPYLLAGNCTATLISRRVVITAGHCVNGNEKKPGVFAFSLAGQTFKIVSIESLEDGKWKDQDIAVLKIDHDVTGVDVPSVELTPLTDIVPLTIVGFGPDSDAGSFGSKREGTVLPVNLFKASTDRAWSGKSLMLSAGPDKSNQIACPGDSGGPVCSKITSFLNRR